jgi:hypothetical protein
VREDSHQEREIGPPYQVDALDVPRGMTIVAAPDDDACDTRFDEQRRQFRESRRRPLLGVAERGTRRNAKRSLERP